jgi:integrase
LLPPLYRVCNSSQTLTAAPERDRHASDLSCAYLSGVEAGSRTSEVLDMTWTEVDEEARLWTVPAARMKGGKEHRVPLTDDMLAILEPLKAMASVYVFEGQKRHKPLSNMSMLMLLRRMGCDGFTVHGFRSSFRDWAAEAANVPRELAEAALAHQVGSNVERAYARSDLLERRIDLMVSWNTHCRLKSLGG